MKKFVFIIIIMLCGCVKEVSTSTKVKELKIAMSINEGGSVLFDPAFTDLHFKSFYKEYPGYYKDLLKYSGKPLMDTSLISQFNYNSSIFYYNLYKGKYISEAYFRNKKDKLNIDTTFFAIEDIDDQLIVFTGFSNDNQIVIIDGNKDKDLGNDMVQSFETNFHKESYFNYEKLVGLPLLDYNYTLFNKNDSLIKYRRKIIIFPSSNNFYTTFFEDDLNKKLHLVGRIKDYWQGSINYKGLGYTVVAQGLSKEYLQILIKPDTVSFSKKSIFFNKNFEYKIKDTINISKDFFVVDSLNWDSNELILKKINIKKYFGFRKGETIFNVELKGLDDKEEYLYSISDKSFTLLDFWGTWCPPCLSDTPILKEIQKKYVKKLAIVGVAYDELPRIKKYVIENELSWQQFYVSKESNSKSILSLLRVDKFPTYILLDKDRRIIYRNTGSLNLEEIEKIINGGKSNYE